MTKAMAGKWGDGLLGKDTGEKGSISARDTSFSKATPCRTTHSCRFIMVLNSSVRENVFKLTTCSP